MRLDEIEETRQQLARRKNLLGVAFTHDPWDCATDAGDTYDRDYRVFQREASAHEQEQQYIAHRGCAPVYQVHISGTLTLATVPETTATCPQPHCGATHMLTLSAIGDASHRAWLTCPSGHQWEHPEITYDKVRLTIDLAAAASRAIADDAPAATLSWKTLYDKAGPAYADCRELTDPSCSRA